MKNSKLTAKERETSTRRRVVSLFRTTNNDEIYIYSVGLVILEAYWYTRSTTLVSSLRLAEVIRDYDFNPRKRRSWRQREVEQFHFHKFPLINRSTSANRARCAPVATVRHYMFHIRNRVWDNVVLCTFVIKRGRPPFSYLDRVSPINTATRCCLNIYSARVEDSINLTNLNMENYIINCTYRFYLHCKILYLCCILVHEVKRRIVFLSLIDSFLFVIPLSIFFFLLSKFYRSTEFESSKRSNEVSKTFSFVRVTNFSIRQNNTSKSDFPRSSLKKTIVSRKKARTMKRAKYALFKSTAYAKIRMSKKSKLGKS